MDGGWATLVHFWKGESNAHCAKVRRTGQNGLRVAEGSGDMLMQPEWRMIAMDAPVSR